MTIYDTTLSVIAADERIARFIGAASPGDLSILYMLLDCEEGTGQTAAASPNADLWGCFTEHGWMTFAGREEYGSAGAGFASLRYGLTENGRRALPIVMAKLVSTGE